MNAARKAMPAVRAIRRVFWGFTLGLSHSSAFNIDLFKFTATRSFK